jgi:Protein of unknown function (DUF3833)
MFKTRASLLLIALATGLTPVGTPVGAEVPIPTAEAALTFRPEIFFLGRTEGVGSLKIMFRHHQRVHVHGRGTIAPDGSIVLDQNIEQAGKPLKHRRWEMRSVGNGNYTATLSDATGPVFGRVQGNVLRLAFPAKGGLQIKQVLTLASDGRSVHNRLTIRKFGIVVATLHETISQLD